VGGINVQISNRNTASVGTGTCTKQRCSSSLSPIGQTGKGELVYSLDCKAIKAENADTNYKPKIPSTTMQETVIPKSGATQTPAETPTTGVNK
jgi:hypothetical protein